MIAHNVHLMKQFNIYLQGLMSVLLEDQLSSDLMYLCIIYNVCVFCQAQSLCDFSEHREAQRTFSSAHSHLLQLG